MTKIINKNYPINVWISTIIIGPIIFCLATLIITRDKPFDTGIFGLFMFGIIYGLLLSLPTLIISFFCFQYLKRQTKNVRVIKTVYILIALFGMAITNYIFFGKDSYNLHQYYAGLTMTLAYGAAILLTGVLYKIEKAQLENKTVVSKNL